MRHFICAVIAMFLLNFSSVEAASGIFDRQVIVQQSGSTTFMGGSAFNNYNFGVFASSQNFVLTGGQLKTWKNGPDDITAAFMYYRIYEASATILPGFDTVLLPWKEEVQSPFGSIDQTWELASFNHNILNGLTDGSYVIEVYFQAYYTVSTVNNIHIDDNSGSNYKAFFTVNNCSLDLGAAMNFCSTFDVVLDAGSGYNSYIWSSGASTQAITVNQPGTYVVTVTNSFCSAVDSVTITSGTSVYSLNIGNDTTLCGLGLVNLNTGAGFTSYMWSTGDTVAAINVNTAGVYAVTVTTTDYCLLMDVCTITVNSLPFVDIGNIVTLCGGDSVVLDAGVGFASYLWSDNTQNQSLTVTAPGMYSVTVSDSAGCQGFDMVNVTAQQWPVAGFSYAQTTGLEVAFTDLSAHSTQNYWDFTGNNNFVMQPLGNVTHTYPYAGSYSVRMVASNACGADTSDVATINVVASTQFLESEYLIRLYPNPAQGQLSIALPTGESIIDMTIASVNGAYLKKESWQIVAGAIHVGALSPGIYMLTIITEKRIINKTFIKQ